MIFLSPLHNHQVPIQVWIHCQLQIDQIWTGCQGLSSMTWFAQNLSIFWGVDELQISYLRGLGINSPWPQYLPRTDELPSSLNVEILYECQLLKIFSQCWITYSLVCKFHKIKDARSIMNRILYFKMWESDVYSGWK